MKLSIITINYNDATGLRKTLASVASQQPCACEVEHVIVDGGSTDGSVDAIRDYESLIVNRSSLIVRWTSEPDKGIYNAMNKGILRATGDYIQILNAGDIYASDDVIARMYAALQEETKRINEKRINNSTATPVELIYGNMLRVDETGKVIGKRGDVPYSLRNYYTSTMNHDCCWIRRDLFNEARYGLYDESLKIVSDWKWFLQAIGLGNVRPVYVDIDVTHFDCTGISERNLALRNDERRKVLEEIMPPAILADYDKYAFCTQQMDRLQKHHLWGLVYFMERVLFKLEKWGICRK